MNSKSTWVWLGIAAVLFAAIVVVEKFGPQPPAGPAPLLPNFQASRVTSVQVGRGDQLEIQALRTNSDWQLIKPITYPAQAASIEALLTVLQQLAPAAVISGAEVRQHKNADEEFGFAKPQVTLTLKSGDEVRPILIGSHTAPGDQVYVQVVGTEGVYVVDAELLKLFPRNADDWRDTAFAELDRMLFDRITVSNALASLELQRDPTNLVWRLSRPMAVRADSQRVYNLLQQLNTARVTRFVTDDPRADLEGFGLHTPGLELGFAQGTNAVATYQFGRSPTNDSTQVFARRVGFNAIVTVPAELIAPWRAAFNQFRDPRVVTFARPVDLVEFSGNDGFSLQRVSSNAWRSVQASFPIDPELAELTVLTLGNLPIEQFKDSITEADLPRYGLAEPARQVVVSTTLTNGATSTNLVLAALSFGVTTNREVFVRRTDENPVYGISPAGYYGLPTAVWQLRDRRIWDFAVSNVVRVTIAEQGQQRELQRAGTNSWALAPGSQGAINPQFIEKAVDQFAGLAATAWTARGTNYFDRLGFTTNQSSLTFELKNGEKFPIAFGGMSPAQYCYAAVTLAGETWIFELPMALHQYRLFALSLSPPKP